jgi:uncharacterized repeat protein (TIGR01451 family)
MHQWMKRPLASALALAALLSPAIAFADGDVTVALTANRMTSTAGGKEVAAPADHAKPGEVIEYRATYHNQGAARVQKLAATLPIPAGTEYIARSASPTPASASLDGRTFESLPLMRKVRLADGREVMREVPASEYRYLRWTLGTLEVHGEQSVRARVRVATTLASSLDQH